MDTTTLDIFASVSPLEYRYLHMPEAAEVRAYLAEEAFVRYMAKVEAALVEAYAAEGLCSKEIAQAVAQAASRITAAEVYHEEERIHHETRALVNCLAQKAGATAAPWIHLGATSEDIIGTANALRYRDFCRRMLLPALCELEKTLISLSLREKESCQIGRTHGQHAVPLTLGFALCEYVSRLGGRIVRLGECSDNLRGKFSGAVGAYNAQSLLLADPLEFEKTFLATLGLKPADHSTQIIEPEYTLDLLHAAVSLFGVFANLSDDMRHLQRSEIGEISEEFTAAQVGSSTMPHKQNPISFENIKSLWKVFVPRVFTAYLDQISEHQRDLTNSASSRFVGEILCALYIATLRLNATLGRLGVNRAALEVNLKKNWHKTIAEPCYLILARNGHVGAHERVRKAVQSGENLSAWLSKELVRPLTASEENTLRGPEHYLGLAIKKTEVVCQEWQEKIAALEVFQSRRDCRC
jgi:adenylosuccinate lyase